MSKSFTAENAEDAEKTLYYHTVSAFPNPSPLCELNDGAYYNTFASLDKYHFIRRVSVL